MMDEEFLGQIEEALPAFGFSDRSSFIRAAVVRELEKRGLDVDLSKTIAPSRSGKGGPSKKPKTKILPKKAKSKPTTKP